MIDFDLHEFIELAEADPDAAAKQLTRFLANLTPAQRGATYVNLAAAYTKLQAEHKEKIAEILGHQVAMLRELEKREKQDLDALDLETVRNQLQK